MIRAATRRAPRPAAVSTSTSTSTSPSADGPPAFPQQAWIDVAVIGVLCLLGILGLETSFGDYNFLLAGLGGLLVGTAVAIVGYRLRLGVLTAVLAGVLAYFALGTPFTMPAQGLFVVLPSLESTAGLALGAVFGWADIVTLGTPVEAPYYMPVLPYFAAWLVALVSTMLASRWLPGRRRTVWRASLLLIGPVLLYLAGILMGTDEAYYAALRGVAFAVIALVWIGWRRSRGSVAASAADLPNGSPVRVGTDGVGTDGVGTGRVGTGRLLRRKVLGTATLVVGAVLVGSLAGAALTPPSDARFVLRDEIEPPFDPLQFASPLAGFRMYTKTLADTPLFTVQGLESGDLLRLASMDSYDGKLWNVAGSGGPSGSGGPGDSGSFRLVGRSIPEPVLATSVQNAEVSITATGYSDVWLPGIGYPHTVDFDDADSRALAENLRYNSSSGTAVFTSGVEEGYEYTIAAALQQTYRDEDLENVPVAQLTLPTVQNIPDVVVAKADEFVGTTETPIDQLRAIEQALKTQGFLSHGLASDGAPSRAGHGADRIDELFTRSQMLGDQEQYASAMALMARSLNYPARVVMGFAPEVPEGADSVEITGTNVTAWVEVAFEGIGWIPFFPTPDQTDVPQDQTPKPKTEPQPQVRQPPRADNEADDLLTAVEIDDSTEDEQDRDFELPAWAWAVIFGAGIPLLAFFGPLLVIAALKARRRRRRRNRGAGDLRVAGAWEELTDGYGELGFDVPTRSSRRQVAEQLEAQQLEAQQREAQQPDTAQQPSSLVTLARSVDRAVFNGQPVDDAAVTRHWSEALASLGAVRASAGWARRLIARFRIRSTRSPRSTRSGGPGRPGRPGKP
ncbi:transglutaminase domain-containing protein [Cryobacterium frigoriphilum]|uniref:Transglutaminase domain-containing protein n=1 Tax=Cryobacterium frigoriphilum TaxID=1259150 RepID=A0A4R9AB55_9MICO|nr:transglutaminase-like domain-containing protein [Cryobacterium frigoriphilum]TFD55279.1 transglutaminase domain-containing protein [Cryobacterium frigoriphilum]